MRPSRTLFAIVVFALAFGMVAEARPHKVVRKEAASVDKNKGEALTATREIFILDSSSEDCYFCKSIAGKNHSAKEMYDLVKQAPAPKAHYTCEMSGDGYWEDVERQCPEYVGHHTCGPTPPGEYWIELTRRVYTEGEEIVYSFMGTVGSESIFTPKPGSKAKPEAMSVGTASAPPLPRSPKKK